MRPLDHPLAPVEGVCRPLRPGKVNEEQLADLDLLNHVGGTTALSHRDLKNGVRPRRRLVGRGRLLCTLFVSLEQDVHNLQPRVI